LTSRSFLEPKIFRATRERGEAILCEQLFLRTIRSLAGDYLILKSGSRERGVYLMS
jgi:hypothetical protein